MYFLLRRTATIMMIISAVELILLWQYSCVVEFGIWSFFRIVIIKSIDDMQKTKPG